MSRPAKAAAAVAPLKEALDHAVFCAGGWLMVANRCKTSVDGLRAARETESGRQWLGVLFSRFGLLPDAATDCNAAVCNKAVDPDG